MAQTLPPQGAPTALGARATVASPETEVGVAWNEVVRDGVVTPADRQYVLACAGDFSYAEAQEMLEIGLNVKEMTINPAKEDGDRVEQLADVALAISAEMDLAREGYNGFYRALLFAAD